MEDVTDRFLYMLAWTLVLRLFAQLIRHTPVKPTLSAEVLEVATDMLVSVFLTTVMLILIYVGIIFISFFIDFL